MTWWFPLIRRLRVEGTSMTPTYHAGEVLLAVRPYRRINPGDVVVVSDPRNRERLLLKRCVAREARRLDIRGDNPAASTDSRDFGWVRTKDVLYLVPRSRHPR